MRTEISEVVLVGNPLRAVQATVQVNLQAGGLATVYSAATGGTTKANPFPTDSHGRIDGYLEAGDYNLVVSAPGYDTYTQPLQLSSGSSSPPDAITATVYDGSGNLTSITQGGVTTTYTYNADGTVATETRAGKTATYSYDASGNPTGSTVA